MIWASDEDSLILVMFWMQAEIAGKKYLDIHSKARDFMHKYILIEYESCIFLPFGVLPLFWCFILNDPLCNYVFVTEELSRMR